MAAAIIFNMLYFLLVGAGMMMLTWWREPIVAYYANKVRHSTPINRQVYVRLDHLLSNKISYFRKLSISGKAKFINRLLLFMKEKKFEGRNELEVTEEMKILVSAAAIQLTFGLENFNLSRFHTIRLAPESFYTNYSHQVKFKGLTSSSGMIFLSWADFLKGYEVDDDKYNLGLHEMAHALKSDIEKGYDFDNKFSFYIDDWVEIGMKEFKQMKRKNPSFLRAYGGRNIEEFFSVCVEHFFEAPEEFQKTLPDIFNHLCFLLNQDPLNVRGDYRFTRAFRQKVNQTKRFIPIPEKIKYNYRYNSWNWTLTAAIAGIFGGFFLSLFLIRYFHDFEFKHFLGISLISAVLSLTIQFSYFHKNEIYSFSGYLVFLFTGVIPITFSLYLLTNFLFATGTRQEIYRIENSKFNGSKVEFQLQNNAYQDEPFFRTTADEGYLRNKPLYYYLMIEWRKGILGFEVLGKKCLLDEDKRLIFR